MSESFVTHRPGAPLHTWQTALKEMGLHGQQKILSVGRARPPIEVASRLGVEPGTEVVLRRRLMLVNGQPYQFADSYYPVEIAGGSVLEGLAKVTGGSAAALELLGVPPERYVEEVSVRPPEEAERALLGIPASTWVMIQLRTAYAAGGRRVEVAHMVMAGDRHQLVYEVPAKRV